MEATKSGTHERLVVNALMLQWLVERTKVDQQDRLMGKLRGLNSGLLERRLGEQSREASDAYQMPPALQRRLERLNLLRQSDSSIKRMLVTGASGAAYRQLCLDRGVPVPPGLRTWQPVGE